VPIPGPPPPAPAAPTGRWSPWILAGSTGFAAAIAGLFGTWVEWSSGEALPFDSDTSFRLDELLGVDARLDGFAVALVAGLGVLIVALHLFGAAPSRTAGYLGAGLAGLLVAVALLEFEWLLSIERRLGAGATAGIGLWLVAGGAALAGTCALAGAWGRGARR
jgi:hypothetical protein